MSIVVTIANQKGGVGKTTTVITLAHGLALKGKEVLIVDLDPQGQCATALGLDETAGVFNWLVVNNRLSEVALPTGRAKLWLLPGNYQTAEAQFLLGFRQAHLNHLAKLLRGGEYDYVVIDTSPSVGGLQERALFAAQLVLIPTACTFLSADAVARTFETVSENVEAGWRGRLLGVQPTFADDQTKECQQTLADLKETYPEALLEPIHRATVLAECAAEGKTIWEKQPTSRAGQEYVKLVYQVLRSK